MSSNSGTIELAEHLIIDTIAGMSEPTRRLHLARVTENAQLCPSTRGPRQFPIFLTAAALFLFALAGCVQPGREEAGSVPPAQVRSIVLTGVRHTRPAAGVPGRLDHLAYDPATGRLFVAALENGSLEVIDLESHQRVRSIGGLREPQGVAVVPKQNCVAVACGGDGFLHVFDTRSLEEKKAVAVGTDADNVRYDAGTGTVLVAFGNTNGGGIAIFEPRSWLRIHDIPFGSHPESFQLDLKGKRLFANLPKGVRAVEDGSVAAIDRTGEAAETQIPLAGRARNFPMAFDAVHERLFVVTRKPARLIVIDTRRDAVLAEAACTDDSDDLFYDARTSRVLVIGGGFRPDTQAPGTASPCSPPGEMGALDVFAVGRNGRLTRLSTTPTAPHARTGLFVPSRRAIYVAVPMRANSDPQILEYRVN
jgi:hypothetical protein